MLFFNLITSNNFVFLWQIVSIISLSSNFLSLYQLLNEQSILIKIKFHENDVFLKIMIPIQQVYHIFLLFQ